MTAIRVQVPLVIHVDREQWARAVCGDPSARAVVESVRREAVDAVTGAVAICDPAAVVELRR